MTNLYAASTPNGHKISIALQELGLPYELHTLGLTARSRSSARLNRPAPTTTGIRLVFGSILSDG